MDEDIVAAEVVAEQGSADLNGGPGPMPRAQEVIELLKYFVPTILAGNAKQAGQWAQHYGLRANRYKVFMTNRDLLGLDPNKDIIVLVGTYRRDRTWEDHEQVTYLMQAGIRIIHGGPF